MQGGAWAVMFSWSRPPAAHFPLSPSRGRPSESTFWAAAPSAGVAVDAAPARVAGAADPDPAVTAVWVDAPVAVGAAEGPALVGPVGAPVGTVSCVAVSFTGAPDWFTA